MIDLAGAVVMTEALLISGYVLVRLVRFLHPRARRQVSVAICENGHRCFSCEPGFQEGRKIDFHREELIAEEFSANCYHLCSACPPVNCEHPCPTCEMDAAGTLRRVPGIR